MAFCFRSDFADEVIDVEKETDFYKYKRVNKNGVEVCYVNILKYNKDLNKEIGDYVSININEIEKILIPSSKALKSKMKDNAIIIKRIGVNNIISYNSEIENYIKNNYKIDVEYYDNYTQAIK